MAKLYNVDGKVLYNYPQHEDLRDALEDAVRLGFNLEGIDLSHQNLSGCDLRGMYAPNSNFSHAIMDKCDLRGADLTGSDMFCCYLTGTNLSRAIMLNVNFQGADLSNCSIIGAGLSGSKFIVTDIDGAVIKDCNMDNITIKEWECPKQKKERFNYKTLKPFDRVLVRNSKIEKWRCEHFSYFNEGNECPYVTFISYKFCVPYNDDTKHLVGTAHEAPEYYRYWED